MLSLTLDTTGPQCAVALAEINAIGGGPGVEGSLLAVSRTEMAKGHAEAVLPAVQAVMRTPGCDYDRLARIVVTTGPGAFTGVRVGLSVARGLALGRALPVLGVTALLAHAFCDLQACTVPDLRRHVILAGRGGQGFYQAFEGVDGDGVPVAACEAVNTTMVEIAAAVTATAGRTVGSGAGALGEISAPDRDTDTVVPGDMVADDIAPIDIGVLARTWPLTSADAYPAVPAYLRPADAAPYRNALPHLA